MEIGKMDDYSLSDLAGSTAIILASCGGLLTVIFSSRCECDMNLCWIWRCHRKPPPLPEEQDEENPIEENIIPKEKIKKIKSKENIIDNASTEEEEQQTNSVSANNENP